MPHDYDLEQLQRKLGRLEQELADARRQLERLATAGSAAPSPSEAPVEPEPIAAVSAAPAPLAEPPLLPPLLAAVPPAPAFTPVKPAAK